jgi:hypothetical protein
MAEDESFEIIKREIQEHHGINPIAMSVKINNYKGCPCCGSNREIKILYWKTEGVCLKAKKFFTYFDEEYKVVTGGLDEEDIPLEEFDGWEKISFDPLIMDAKNAMETKMWAKKEQTDEAWDKNREVY